MLMPNVRALINHWERLQEPVRQQLASTAKAQPLPERMQKTVALMSRADLSGVRVHYNSRLPQAIEARAYTRGNDIHLAPGQERHLPHEVWHVVQQRQGRVNAPGPGGHLGGPTGGHLGLPMGGGHLGLPTGGGHLGLPMGGGHLGLPMGGGHLGLPMGGGHLGLPMGGGHLGAPSALGQRTQALMDTLPAGALAAAASAAG